MIEIETELTTIQDIRAKERRLGVIKERREMKNRLQEFLKNGITFHTIRDDYPSNQLGGGLIVAQRQLKSGKIEVAFSFCHPTDQFKKLNGKYIAGSRLVNGNGVVLPSGKAAMQRMSDFFATQW
jgi:hypothetical protein